MSVWWCSTVQVAARDFPSRAAANIDVVDDSTSMWAKRSALQIESLVAPGHSTNSDRRILPVLLSARVKMSRATHFVGAADLPQ